MSKKKSYDLPLQIPSDAKEINEEDLVPSKAIENAFLLDKEENDHFEEAKQPKDVKKLEDNKQAKDKPQGEIDKPSHDSIMSQISLLSQNLDKLNDELSSAIPNYKEFKEDKTTHLEIETTVKLFSSERPESLKDKSIGTYTSKLYGEEGLKNYRRNLHEDNEKEVGTIFKRYTPREQVDYKAYQYKRKY